MRGKHGVSDRCLVQLRAGFRFPLEDGGRDERHVPGLVSAASGVCGFLIFHIFPFYAVILY